MTLCLKCIVLRQSLQLESESDSRDIEKELNLDTGVDTTDLSVPQAPKEIEMQLSDPTSTKQQSTAFVFF